MFSGSLFDTKQPAATSLFGNTSSVSSTSPATGLFSSSSTTTALQKPASFSFFSNQTTPQATGVPSLGVTPPASNVQAPAQMNTFQFTPISSTQQTTPLSEPAKPQMFVPNLSAPMINFTSNAQPNGFVFT